MNCIPPEPEDFLREDIKNLPPAVKDSINRQAYNDVVDGRLPTNPSNRYYMNCYNFWKFVEKM